LFSAGPLRGELLGDLLDSAIVFPMRSFNDSISPRNSGSNASAFLLSPWRDLESFGSCRYLFKRLAVTIWSTLVRHSPAAVRVLTSAARARITVR